MLRVVSFMCILRQLTFLKKFKITRLKKEDNGVLFCPSLLPRRRPRLFCKLPRTQAPGERGGTSAFRLQGCGRGLFCSRELGNPTLDTRLRGAFPPALASVALPLGPRHPFHWGRLGWGEAPFLQAAVRPRPPLSCEMLPRASNRISVRGVAALRGGSGVAQPWDGSLVSVH